MSNFEIRKVDTRIIDSKHNLPPTDAEILSEKLTENSRKDLIEMDALLARPAPEVINDEVENKALELFVDRIKSLKKTFDVAHKREKAPYLEMGRVVDGFFKDRIAALDDHISKMNAPRTVFLNAKAEAERKRIFEAAERARQEAEALAAQSLAHEQADIKDTAAELIDMAVATEAKADRLNAYAAESKASKLAGGLVVRWTGEIQDMGAVDLEKLRPYLSDEAIQTAVNKYVRDGGRDLAGVKIYQKSEAK
jgi:hypothetical protein